MVDRRVRLSNPESAGKTPGQQRFSVTIVASQRRRSESSEAEFNSSAYWLEQKGRLSNPRSDLNQALDLLTAGLEAIGFQPGAVARPPQSGVKRQKVRQLSPAQVDDLVERYRAGASAPQLAEVFGIHRLTVLEHLKRRDVPRRANTRKMTDEQAREARAMWQIGMSYAEIACRLGVHPKTAKREIESVLSRNAGLENL